MNLGTTPVSDLRGQGPNVRIYPNPSSGQAWMDVYGVTSDDQVEVQISNALGVAVSKLSVSPGNNHSIALPYLPQGIYTVIVYQGRSVGQPQKLIIED